jgi:ribonuclease P/MRP protein subunit RPP40
LDGGELEVTEAEKDVGVMITANLKPSLQCARVAKKANMVLVQLARGVTYRNRVTFIRLYQVFVLPHLSYSAPAWAPYTMADKELLEKVQRRAIMMVTNMKGSYEERLAILGMRTLEDRRLRGDLIETYKILTGKSDVKYQTWFQLAKNEVGTVSTRAET